MGSRRHVIHSSSITSRVFVFPLSPNKLKLVITPFSIIRNRQSDEAHMKKLAGGFDSFRKTRAKYWRQCESYSVVFEVWLPMVERHGSQTSVCFQKWKWPCRLGIQYCFCARSLMCSDSLWTLPFTDHTMIMGLIVPNSTSSYIWTRIWEVAGAASCQREHCHCYDRGVELWTFFPLTHPFQGVDLASPAKVGVKRPCAFLSEKSRIQHSHHTSYPREKESHPGMLLLWKSFSFKTSVFSAWKLVSNSFILRVDEC